ncbi:MAG: Rieske (2Fe-2S) protein [Candidatus Aramenus sulfurataquae]|jgi:nitrite reductase/ring-hydroxylating ferredoxin subunit|uniref:Rieske (2Fe-2S) protein n=2 Tax=Candidatus Aramenus sulfurataquae TaxID=1326980 RepID=A0AAE3K2B3_9CREN|nr:Rieske (2Fe-2S) protein [Candidatus Aramenus sulfurataquae]
MKYARIKMNEIPKNSMVEFYFPAEKPWEREPFLLVNFDGEMYALEAFCTHDGLSLEDGFLTENGRVVCPWHGSVFDVKTGKVLDGPAKRDLKKYNVKIEGEEVIVSE